MAGNVEDSTADVVVPVGLGACTLPREFGAGSKSSKQVPDAVVPVLWTQPADGIDRSQVRH